MSASATKGLCLLLVVIVTFAHVSTASASAAVANKNSNDNKSKRLPGSCLMAASTLCANADTNAMRCLTVLAIKGDARVPNACAEAIMATKNPLRNQGSRAKRMSRMLNEGGNGNCAAGNTCPSSFAAVKHNNCNDANDGCVCGQTFTIPANAQYRTIAGPDDNFQIPCADICCKHAAGIPACCHSGAEGFVYCLGTNSAHNWCTDLTSGA